MKEIVDLMLDLTRPQAMKLVKGGAIQVKASHVGRGMPVRMEKKKAMKLIRRAQKGLGGRVQLSPMEIEGSGLLDVLKGVGRAVSKVLPIGDIAKFAAKTVLPAVAQKYAPSLAPTVSALTSGIQAPTARELTASTIRKAAPVIAQRVGGERAGQFASDVAQQYGDIAAQKIGERAGFGVRARGVRGGKIKAKDYGMVIPSDTSEDVGFSMGTKKKGGRSYKVASNDSQFFSTESAAMNPPADAVPPSGAFIFRSRGSGVLMPGERRMR